MFRGFDLQSIVKPGRGCTMSECVEDQDVLVPSWMELERGLQVNFNTLYHRISHPYS